MKKLGLTTFAVLYAFLTLSLSAERSNAWAIQEAQSLAHPCGDQHAPALNSAPQSDPHLPQKKRVETEFVIELPQESVLFQNPFSRLILLSTFARFDSQIGQPSSSRSPPSLA